MPKNPNKVQKIFATKSDLTDSLIENYLLKLS